MIAGENLVSEQGWMFNKCIAFLFRCWFDWNVSWRASCWLDCCTIWLVSNVYFDDSFECHWSDDFISSGSISTANETSFDIIDQCDCSIEEIPTFSFSSFFNWFLSIRKEEVINQWSNNHCDMYSIAKIECELE